MRRFLLPVGGSVIVAAITLAPAHGITLDWVSVGDPGNSADTTGYGAVAGSFQIMQYEFTNQQYTDFLNSVDASGSNPNGIYNSNMGNSVRGGIAFNSAAAAGSKYSVKTDMGNKPVNYITWFMAARVANWVENGATSGASTETGAYTLNNATSGNLPSLNPGANYFVPSEDQWYKAAYYKGGGTNAGYWDYATQTDSLPTSVTATISGDGSAGNTGNFANYNSGADWNGTSSLNPAGNVTTVGTNGGPSAFAAFDLGGNVWEWTTGVGGSPANAVARGSDWWSAGFSFGIDSSRRVPIVGTYNDDASGFRLATAIPVPEPVTLGLAAIGIAGAGLGFRRRQLARRKGHPPAAS